MDKDLFIFDLDGVLYRTDKPIQSGINAVKTLLKKGKKVAFLTNNSTKTPENFAKKLKKMGLKIDHKNIFTSALISANNLSKIYNVNNSKAFVIGEKGLISLLKNRGFEILNEKYPNISNLKKLPADINADFVIVGWDRNVTFNKFRAAMMLIQKGAKYYATNDDSSFPALDTFWPGSGANVAFLSKALNQKPEKIFGKPYSESIVTVLKFFNVSSNKAVIIGDRLETDILGGIREGLTTVLVETGVNSRVDIVNISKQYDESLEPTIIVKTLEDIDW